MVSLLDGLAIEERSHAGHGELVVIDRGREVCLRRGELIGDVVVERLREGLLGHLGDTTRVDTREDKAWLLRNRFNPFPISGILSLEGRVLSFRLDSEAADATLGWLSEELDADDLA